MKSLGIQRRTYKAICRKCGLQRCLSRSDYRPDCPRCTAIFYARRRYLDNHAHVLAVAKTSRQKCHVQIAIYMRAYRRRHHKRLILQKRNWDRCNAERIVAYSKRYYGLNKARLSRVVKRWRVTHRSRCLELARAAQHRRRALKRGSRIGRVSYIRIWQRDHGRCGLCRKRVTRQRMHYDHIIPLSRNGSHTETNIQLAHAHCNLSKHAKIIPQEPAMTSGRR